MQTNIATALIVTFIATAASAAEPAPTVSVEANGDSARACLAFAHALDTSADAQPGDFVSIEPALHPTVTVTGAELCVDGLGYGVHYSIAVQPGLAFKGGRLDTKLTARP